MAAAAPRATVTRTFQRTIFIAELVDGKLETSQTLTVRFSEFEAYVMGIMSNVNDALEQEDSLILTDSQGKQSWTLKEPERHVMPALDDDSGSDREDELPQVVVLKGGDLTAEEVKKINAEMHTGGGSAEKDDGPPPGGKIFFKKPAKRSSSDKFQGLTSSSSKKKKSDEGEKKEMKSGKKVKNNSLLSFGGDEEKDED
ncbi:uncharacterized protein KIAA1143 homolog isoform X1 [Hippoglossus stenolepis]|uniref:uncharacterized protein KIAA1143 homolog isoform X1 n=1 Tax=Hippoglossus stenolepis TaxID=195615 RepID=UPI00159C4F3B|nr:uncharacterized protein KIAA1143 homolog isoform X1 [Hippoglossus stenolepis]